MPSLSIYRRTIRALSAGFARNPMDKKQACPES